MSTDDVIEQAARLLSTHETFTGKPHPRDHHRRQARALADAGLLSLLGDPEQPPARPPWHGAPAVITDCLHCPEQIGPTVQVDLVGRGWTCSHCGNFTEWTADVTPLYPKEDQ